MRVLILGIDALEYELVEEWNLKNLKQTEYGKINVPITKEVGEPATEIIWPCFITGKKPKDMGYTNTILYRQPFKLFFENIYVRFSGSGGDIHPEDIMQKRTKKREILDKLSTLCKKLGISYHPSRKDIKADSLFENEKIKSAHFHIPVYDPDAFPEYRKQLVDVLLKKVSTKSFYKSCKESFFERGEELENYLRNNEEWDLVMMYWFSLDAIQHAFFKSKLNIMNFYMLINQYIGKLIKKIPKDTLIIIISDHGQKKGIHTNHGFYSVNKKLNLKNPDITDFKRLIEQTIMEEKTK